MPRKSDNAARSMHDEVWGGAYKAEAWSVHPFNPKNNVNYTADETNLHAERWQGYPIFRTIPELDNAPKVLACQTHWNNMQTARRMVADPPRPMNKPVPVHVAVCLLDGDASIARVQAVEGRRQAVGNSTITLPLGSRSCQRPAGRADFTHYEKGNRFR